MKFKVNKLKLKGSVCVKVNLGLYWVAIAAKVVVR